jgi:hypothetical protein
MVASLLGCSHLWFLVIFLDLERQKVLDMDIHGPGGDLLKGLSALNEAAQGNDPSISSKLAIWILLGFCLEALARWGNDKHTKIGRSLSLFWWVVSVVLLLLYIIPIWLWIIVALVLLGFGIWYFHLRKPPGAPPKPHDTHENPSSD